MNDHRHSIRAGRRLPSAIALAVLAAATGAGSLRAQQQRPAPQQPEQEGFRFRSAVELINVTATVSDSSGRFVPGLRKEDFVVYEDDEPQRVTQFSSDRVPVSLGIAVDTSGSMAGEKMDAAREALNRFVFELLDRDDEIFLYRFSNNTELMQNWTKNRDTLGRSIQRLSANGGTAMYDAVAESVQMAQGGQHRKKALVLISDGNDTSSGTDVRSVKQLIRETEVLVYAIGIDGHGTNSSGTFGQPRVPIPIPFPFPIPGQPRRRTPWPPGPTNPGPQISISRDDRVNVGALRDLTDDSGGRTEIIRSSRDLGPATEDIADELSKQYYLGYESKGLSDGRWHSIRVEVRGERYVVRSRRGYVAS